jgi:peroxiredoxin
MMKTTANNIPMFRTLTTAFFLLAIVGSLAAQDTHITFDIKGLDNKNVKIEHFESKASQVFSGPADANGQLKVQMKLTAYGFYKVTLDNGKGDFFLITGPGEKMTIRSSMDNLIGAMKVEGSPVNAEYLKVRAHSDSLKVVLAALEQQHKQLSQQPGASQEKLQEIVQLYTAIQNQRIGAIRNFMAANPESLAVLFFTEEIKPENEPALFDVIIAALVKKHPTNFYVLDLKRKIEVDKVTRIGSVAPDIALPNPDGDTIRLSSLRGNYVLLDFWAAWCGPCRRENPNLVRLYSQYKDKGFEIYGVSLDRDKASWVKGIQDDKLTWTLVSDLKYWSSEPAKLYGVTSIPHAILLDREGRIIAKKVRAHELEKMLAEIFAAEGKN